MVRHSFPAMGTEVDVLLDADDTSMLEDAEREFLRLEAVLSRFLPGSQLSRLNETGELVVGPELIELVELAVEARELTGGRFDPTVHDAVVAAGYDRSFELVDLVGTDVACAPPRTGGRVEIDHSSGRVTLEPGFKLDLGGIAKGWAADRVAARLERAGSALVNAGGDIAVAGSREWPVAVEAAGRAVTLGLAEGGLATSGRDRRTWTRSGRARHHIVDPATGRPAETDVLAVTVAASSATEAEALATSLFLSRCGEQAVTEADAAGVSAVLVMEDGTVHLTGALA